MLVQRFLGLRGDTDPIVRQAEGILEDEVRDAVGIHEREAHGGHAASRVTKDSDLPHAEVIQQG